jgi:integrase
MRLKLRGKYWTLYIRHRGQRYVVSSRTTSQKRANAWARDFIAKLEAGEYRKHEDDVRFERLVELARDFYRINNRRSGKSLEFVMKRIGKTFAGVRAIDITSARIERYKAARIEAGGAKSSINGELSALSLMFRLAVDNGLLGRAPRIRYLDDSDNVRQGFVTQADYQAIRTHLPERVADLTDFLWWTGLRLGTACQLEWRDVLESTIRIRSETVKTAQAHELSLMGEIAAIIARAVVYRTPVSRRVFHRNGRPMVPSSVGHTWKRAALAAGLGHILIHDLRRSFVRNMRLAGMPEATIMRFTGHRTRAVFDRYSIVNVEEQRTALERMSEYLAAQPTATKVTKL